MSKKKTKTVSDCTLPPFNDKYRRALLYINKTRLKIRGTPLNPLVDLLKVEHLDVDEDDRHRLLLVVPLRPERQPPDPVSHVCYPDRALGAQQPLSVQLVMLGARAISKSGDEMFSIYLIKTKFKEG